MSNFKNAEMIKLEQYLIEHGYNYEAKVGPWASGEQITVIISGMWCLAVAPLASSRVCLS